MAKEFFKNFPNTTTPLTAPRINGLLDGEEAMGNIVVESIKGKNLFNKNTYSNTGYLLNDGSITSNSSFIITNYISVEPGDKITFSGDNNSGTNPSICYYNSSMTFISGTKHNGNPRGTITIPANCYYIRESVNVNDIDTLQIEKGTSATDYTEYQGIGYVSGTNSNGSYIKFDDGTLICSIVVSKTEFLSSTSTYTAVQGINWYRSNAPSISFPYTFIDTNYAMTITPEVSTSGSRMIVPRIHAKYLDRATIQLMSVDDFISTGTAYTNLASVNIQIIGKWK